ncbi:hypothetical protein CP532_6967 [Ophiocordyceps camponoti-leonardi (nom. inval.)]|nr:hypothetical protein CP532_6967 [Ophiocordyceps camponoti-leonardi (nom. inval.)]
MTQSHPGITQRRPSSHFNGRLIGLKDSLEQEAEGADRPVYPVFLNVEAKFKMRLLHSSSSFVTAALLFLGQDVAAAPDSSLSWSNGEPLFTFNYSTPNPDSKNWVGLYNSFYGGPDNGSYVANSLAWAYAPQGDGTVRVPPPDNLPSGTYKAFFLAKDGYEHLTDPVDVIMPGNGPLSFLVDQFTTRNGRQGDAFNANVKGLITNQRDTNTKFAKKSSDGDGGDWVQVSEDGTLSGTPDASGEKRVTVEATGSDGTKAQLQVKIPVREKGSPLVDRIGVLSFNMWHGGTQVNDYHRKQVKYLVGSNVDIVGLQESNDGQAIRLGQALGWDSWQGRDVGIISRYPMVERFNATQAAGAVRIALDGDASQVIFWNAHLGYTPYGPYDFCFDNMTVDAVMQREKESGRTPQILEIMDRMKPQLADTDRLPVLLTGDMNAPSHLDWTDATRDQHCGVGAVAWPSSEEPTKGGLVDSYREIHKDPAADPGITWSPIYLDNEGRPEPMDRIDFVYHKGLDVVDSVHEVVGQPRPEPDHKDNEWTSDHAAVRSTFQVPAKQKKHDDSPIFYPLSTLSAALLPAAPPPPIMDGLDEFEKTLAAEKAARELTERRHDKHRHRHHRRRHDDANRERGEDADRHRRHRRRRDKSADDDEDERHRHKRSRRSDDKDGEPPLVRDAWMTAPSALVVEHMHRPDRPKRPPASPQRVIHSRELNTSLNKPDAEKPLRSAAVADDDNDDPDCYTFGDDGSSWRMTKLKAVYDAAKESGRPVEELALDKYGSLAEFDDAREEQLELERRTLYGEGCRQCERPTGKLHRERLRNNPVIVDDDHIDEPESDDEPQPRPEQPHTKSSVDHTSLNRLRAQMMKAKLRGAPDAAKLEAEYNRAAAAAEAAPSEAAVVILDAAHSRHLAGRGKEVQQSSSRRRRSRGALSDNEDMTVEDMVREERRTRHDGDASSARRQAERIARDGRFTDGLDYLDDNAARLARGVHRSDAALRAAAAADTQRMARALDRCQLCRDDENEADADADADDDKARRHPPRRRGPHRAPVVSLATRVFLTVAPDPEITPGGAVIAPLSHRATLLECDDDEWHELRNFMKSLTRMYHDQGRDVVFYENATSSPDRHAAMVAVPIPYDRGGLAPAFFREAILSAAPEWSVHAKVIDTASRGGLRRSLPRSLPAYFHAWLGGIDGGLAHVIEEPRNWPSGDRFAREVIAAVVGEDVEPGLARRHARWGGGDEQRRVDGFRKRWRPFDWTRLLVEGEGGSS